jgi:hypothetical protein
MLNVRVQNPKGKTAMSNLRIVLHAFGNLDFL